MELDQSAILWLVHLKTWQQSGSTQEAYCKTNSLHPKRFSNRKRRLRNHLPELPNLTNSTVVPPNLVAPLVAVKLIDDLCDNPALVVTKFEHNIPETVGTGNSSGISLTVGGKYHVTVKSGANPHNCFTGSDSN